jgi:hypothetical protein
MRAVFKTKFTLRTCLVRTTPVSAQQERAYCVNFAECTWKKQIDHFVCVCVRESEREREIGGA